jgi:hypothetical protein
MGKYSDFERVERDFYPTPYDAVVPLIPHLGEIGFVEPCAGDGTLIEHLESFGNECMWASDIEPQKKDILKIDALDEGTLFPTNYMVITNPPWDRKILHPMIEKFSQKTPAWLLFDSNWANTKQAVPYLKKCTIIQTVGRVKWFGGTTGKEDCAWYKFVPWECRTTFYGRIE